MAYGLAVDPFHGTVETALVLVEKNVPPDATLAVLPEGAMINYLSRRVNPTPSSPGSRGDGGVRSNQHDRRLEKTVPTMS